MSTVEADKTFHESRSGSESYGEIDQSSTGKKMMEQSSKNDFEKGDEEHIYEEVRKESADKPHPTNIGKKEYQSVQTTNDAIHAEDKNKKQVREIFLFGNKWDRN